MAPIITIVGETASGKSALAIELAKQFNGEIICADSRTVYKGMDIGTAKPSKVEQAVITHHVIDVVEPDGHFSAAEFKHLADQLIQDITNRGKLPIMVGGTGLYIDAVLFNYQFGSSDAKRDPQNPRHLLKEDSTASQRELRPDTLIIGLKMDREELRKRITERIENMIANGLIQEVERLAANYGWEVESMRGTAYRAFRDYLDGTANLDETKEKFIQNDLNLAKKQRTWFKRNKSIHWLNDPSQAVDIVTTFLNKIQ